MNEAVAEMPAAPTGRNGWIAALLAFFFPIAGFAYVRKPLVGIVVFALPLLALLLLGRTGLMFATGTMLALMIVGGLFRLCVVTFAVVAAGRVSPDAPRPWYDRWYHLLWMALITFVIANVVLVVRGPLFGYEPFRIPSTSMQPTIQVGDFVLADYRASTMANIARGDVVVYVPAHHPDQKWIKRVVGLPGERVDLENDGHVSINGVPLEEHGLRVYADVLPGNYQHVRLGADEYYLLGDNRPESEDSRYTGPVKRDVFRAKLRTIWFHYMSPEGFDFSRIGPLADAPAR